MWCMSLDGSPLGLSSSGESKSADEVKSLVGPPLCERRALGVSRYPLGVRDAASSEVLNVVACVALCHCWIIRLPVDSNPEAQSRASGRRPGVKVLACQPSDLL